MVQRSHPLPINSHGMGSTWVIIVYWVTAQVSGLAKTRWGWKSVLLAFPNSISLQCPNKGGRLEINMSYFQTGSLILSMLTWKYILLVSIQFTSKSVILGQQPTSSLDATPSLTDACLFSQPRSTCAFAMVGKTWGRKTHWCSWPQCHLMFMCGPLAWLYSCPSVWKAEFLQAG